MRRGRCARGNRGKQRETSRVRRRPRSVYGFRRIDRAVFRHRRRTETDEAAIMILIYGRAGEIGKNNHSILNTRSLGLVLKPEDRFSGPRIGERAPPQFSVP